MTGQVLIVDNSEKQRRVLRMMLATAGLRAVEAPDMASAQAVLRRGDAPRAAIVHCQHCTADNGAAIALMRQANPVLPIVAIVPDTVGDRIAALEAGADDVISAPVEQALLTARLRRIMRPSGHLAMQMSQGLGLGMAEAAAPFQRPDRVILLGPALPELPDGLALHQISRLADLPSGDQADALILSVAQGDLGAATLAQARQVMSCPVLVAAGPDAPADLAAQALNAGATDVLTAAMDRREVGIRLRRVISANAHRVQSAQRRQQARLG